MGAAKSKSASIVNASKPARALPRPGATPIAPYVPPDTFVQASPVDDARADDTALRESEHKCRLNRAACLLKLQGYGAARRECEAVLAEDGQHAKAHFRLGAALEALGELGAAQKAYTQAQRTRPASKPTLSISSAPSGSSRSAATSSSM